MTHKPKWTDLFGIDPDYTEDAAEEPKYTESDMRVLTEAALRLGRKEAEDTLEAALKEVAPGSMGAAAYKLALAVLRDASSARTDLSVDTDLPQDSQARSKRVPQVHKPFPDDGVTYCGWHTGNGVIHEGCGEVWPCRGVRNSIGGDQ